MSGITVGVDGSENSISALDWAMREAILRQAPLTVIAVHEVIASYWTGTPVTMVQDEHALNVTREAAEKATAKAVAKLGDEQPPSVTVQAVNGFAAQELIHASADTDMLVLGARGGGLAHRILGSVSTKVAHHAACPLVLVPASADHES
jgi:nucleotide-binding universal stress UspA family protein